MGFNNVEVCIAMDFAYNRGVNMSIGSICSTYCVDYETARRIRYAAQIVLGEVGNPFEDVNTPYDVMRIKYHYRKLAGNQFREISVENLVSSTIHSVPKMFIIDGIEDETFNILNSDKHNSIKSEAYIVEKMTSGSIIFKTKKKIILKYNRSRKYGIEGCIEVLGKDFNGNSVVKINKSLCKMCNRYCIVASTRIPSEYLCMCTIVSKNGNLIYVYAKMIRSGNTVVTKAVERVYDFGIDIREAKNKVLEVSKQIYNIYDGVYSNFFAGNSKFRLVDRKDSECEIYM